MAKTAQPGIGPDSPKADSKEENIREFLAAEISAGGKHQPKG
jgi:hypothetical protein